MAVSSLPSGDAPARSLGLQPFVGGTAMAETLRNELVITYLKQLRLNRVARDCESLAREAEQRGLGYLGYLQALLEAEVAHRQEQRLRQRIKAAAFPYQKRLEDFDFSLLPSIPNLHLLDRTQAPFLPPHPKFH